MKMERFGNRVLNIICVSFLAFLMLLSFFTTQRMGVEAWGEIDNGCPIYWEWDNLLWHLAGIGLVLLFVRGCHLWERRKSAVMAGLQTWGSKTTRILMAAAAATVAWLIFAGGIRTPADDQLQVYSAAMLFSKGVYANLIPGGYMEMYPQQLGYAGYLQLLFQIFGREDFKDAQMVNCFIIGAIHYNLSGFAEQMTEDRKTVLLTGVLSLLFLPLFLLCSWVYGDLPFFLLALLAARCLLHMLKKSGCLSWLMICFLSAALLFRKNAWIFITSLSIALCFYAVRVKKKFLILIAVLSILVPALAGKATQIYYERISGCDINGLPSVMWIAMGITEGDSKPGWFFNYAIPVYYASGYNQEESAKAALDQIKGRIGYFRENPIYAVSFYKRKIATQWNDPFWGTEYLLEADAESKLTEVSAYALAAKNGIRIFLSVWQNILYLGALLYGIFAAREKALPENIGLIYFVGGFLFSILWEGNSRYVLPYALLLIPYAAMGWVRLCGQKGRAVIGAAG